MSVGPWNTAAEGLKTRLDAWAGLGSTGVIVDKQKDIRSEVLSAIEKEAGVAITILFDGFQVPDTDTSGPKTVARYSIRVWGLPIVQETSPAFLHAEDAAAEVAKALHLYRVDGLHNFAESRVGDGDLIDDPNFLIYELTVTVPVYLTNS